MLSVQDPAAFRYILEVSTRHALGSTGAGALRFRAQVARHLVWLPKSSGSVGRLSASLQGVWASETHSSGQEPNMGLQRLAVNGPGLQV